MNKFTMRLLGLLLLTAAGCLQLHDFRQDQTAGTASHQTVATLREALPRQTTPPVPTETLDTEMPIEIRDGYGYIGILTISAIDIELPVMAEWDYIRLQLAPCRQSGSTRDDTLLIAAHNYNSHFARLSHLKPGDPIKLTDMAGIQNHYTVTKTETLPPNSLDYIQSQNAALTLYTCTPSGDNRVVVFCERG